MANTVDIIIKAKDQASRVLKAPIKSMADMKKAMNALSGPAKLVGGAVAGALAFITKKSIDAADELLKTSQKIGTTVESLSTLKHAASQSGVEFEALEKGLLKLNQMQIEVISGNKEAAQAFKAIGVSVKDANGNLKTNDALLKEIADKFLLLPDGPIKSALAMKLFGKSAGPDLIPMLKMGSAGISEMQQEARKLGLEISTETAKRAEKFNDNMSIILGTTTRFGNAVAEKVLPSLLKMSEYLADASRESFSLRFWIDKTSDAIGFLAKLSVRAAEIIVASFHGTATTLVTVFTAMAAAAAGRFEFAKNTVIDGFKEIKSDVNMVYSDITAMFEERMNDPNQPKMGDALLGTDEAMKKKFERQAAEALRITQETSKQVNYAAVMGALAGANAVKIIDSKTADQRTKAFEIMFNSLITLSNSKNRVLAGIGKAAAIAQATIDTYTGANKALAELGPFGFPAAAAIIVAGLANVASIAGVELAEGGIAMPRPGGVQATIAEAGVPEAVIPLDRAGDFFGPSENHVEVSLDGRTLLDFVYQSSKNGTLRIDKRALA